MHLPPATPFTSPSQQPAPTTPFQSVQAFAHPLSRNNVTTSFNVSSSSSGLTPLTKANSDVSRQQNIDTVTILVDRIQQLSTECEKLRAEVAALRLAAGK